MAGGASILLSALAVLPHFWAKIPATIVGFAAIALGMTAWTGVGRSKGRQRGLGLILIGSLGGAAGMFLGPLGLAPLGERQRESSGQAWTERHLTQIGAALDRFSTEKQHFPPGGVFETAADGTDRPMHGWMTALLPYLGQERLSHSIHRDLPFDDPANHDAMSTVVETFLAAGASREPVAQGRAPAHFSGVGGDVVIPGQGLAHLGIFARNSAVRQDQILDGLSHTLVAGEVAHLYPAWGEPENWREVGKGLNVQSRGFGNADATGALFLKADGSVQFFSNQTSPDLLLRLSTRDGGDGHSEVP